MNTLTPPQQYVLRLLLRGAGKTIVHRGNVCEVLETHDRIRQLLPLTESKVSPFWVPRRSENRKTMRNERIRRRQYASGARTFAVPHYPGEPRPINFDSVPLDCLFARTADLESSGDLAPELSKVPLPALQARGFHLIPSRAVRRTTQGFFSRKSVEAALAKMRTNTVMKIALTEVVFARQSPTEVARDYVVPLDTLKRYATRLRTRIITLRDDTKSGQKANKNALSQPEVSPFCIDYREDG